eukprot:jgi/Ulvmu1/12235/UM086_0025.1
MVDLARVMRVADALSDKRRGAWASALATRESEADWSNWEESEEMHSALLSLPPPVLTETTAGADKQRCHWRRLLAAVAAQPCLTSISLGILNAFEPLPWPDAFPRLQELVLTCESRRHKAGHLRELSRRIPSTPPCHPVCPALTSLSFVVSDADGLAESLKEFWLPIGAGGRQCLTMRRLHLDICAGRSVDADEAMWTGPTGVLQICPHLEDVDVRSCARYPIAVRVGSHLRSMHSITSVRMHGGAKATHVASDQADEAADAICSLSGLRSLLLHAACNPPTSCCVLRAVHSMGAGPLPDLTRLDLRMHPKE